MISIEHIDHFVLTVASIKRACKFYSEKLGMEIITFDNNHKALKFGEQKISLHQLGTARLLRARNVHPGSVDVCFITKTPIQQVKEELEEQKVALFSGIIKRMGAKGVISSIYFHDPDGNLLEISNYTNEDY